MRRKDEGEVQGNKEEKMEDMVEVEEEWNPKRHIIKVNREVIRDEPNPYPYKPVHEMKVNDEVESDMEL